MKIFRIAKWFSAFMLLCAVSCAEDPMELGQDGYCTVTFQNCEDIDPVKVLTGTPMEKPETPATPTGREGYIFENWYSDSVYNNVWDFSASVNNSMNLYAKWVDENGDISPDDGAEVELAAMNDVTKRRPYLWSTNAERDELLSDIATYSWAQTMVTKMHSAVDSKAEQHMLNPATILSTIPTIQTNDDFTSSTTYSAAHGAILLPVAEAAILYHITRENKYAVYATDVLMYYLTELSPRAQSKISIGGEYFYDPRYVYNWIAIAYDFLYNYLNYEDVNGNKRQYYDLNKNALVDYDNDVAQRAMIKIARNTLDVVAAGTYTADNKKGVTALASGVTNHPILTAPGSLFTILCVDDTYKEVSSEFGGRNYKRKDLFKLFWETGTKRQNSWTETILPKYSNQGMWPESTSYGFMQFVPEMLNVVDKIVENEHKLKLKEDECLLYGKSNIFDEYSDASKMMPGSVIFDYLRFPDRRFVRYGDSKRNTDNSDDLYRITLSIAERRPNQSFDGKTFSEYAKVAREGLETAYAINGYSPSITNTGDGGLSKLFWGVDVEPALDGGSLIDAPTAIVEHAGVVLQRNHPTEGDVEMYGLCGIIGGANYVHNHASGIAMELYGCGYIMAAAGGLAETLDGRSTAEHIEYFQHYAGNNTVIMNSASTGSSTGSWNSGNFLTQDDCELIRAEPADHYTNPISKNFSFATQELDDSINKCLQRRTLAIVRTSPTTGYYFDVFRSAGDSKASHHDYVYHNLGTNVTFSDLNENKTYSGSDLVSTTFYETSSKTLTQGTDQVRVPGWEDHFVASTTKQISGKQSNTIKARFDVAGKYMHMIMAGGQARYYTKSTGPATREALSPFDNTATQIVVVRHEDDVWNNPFLTVLEPSASESGSVQSVEPLQSSDKTKTVGVVVTSKVGNQTIEDYIICHADLENETYDVDGIYFQGHYGVIRVISTEGVETKDVVLYIGCGKEIQYKNSTCNLTVTTAMGKKTTTITGVTL